VVDLFKLYTFDLGHIFIRAIVWKKILLYSELLELFQNLRTGPHLLPPASPSLFLCSAAHRPSLAFPPAASCPLAALPAPPGHSSSARRSPNPAGSSSHGRVALLPARATTCPVDRQQLLAARPRAPLFGFETRLVNFSLLLFPRAHPHSCSLLGSTTSPEHLCPPPSAASAAPPLQFHAPPAPPHLTTPEHRTGDLTPAAVFFLVEPKFHPFSSLAKSTISTTSPG
jgi:hypothetical protein